MHCWRRRWRSSSNSVEVTRLSEVKPEDTSRYAMAIGASPLSSDALVMLIDCDAIAVVVSALFGGDPDLPVTPIARELSPTELEVAGIVFQEVAASVNGWGARALDIKFPAASGDHRNRPEEKDPARWAGGAPGFFIVHRRDFRDLVPAHAAARFDAPDGCRRRRQPNPP